RPGAHPSVAWRWSLESGLRSKDSRVVRRRVVGKVPIEATRWRPILLHVPFLGGWVGAIPPGYPAAGSNPGSLAGQFVDGRSCSIRSDLRFYETLLFSRDWLGRGEEKGNSSASICALQTAIN